MKTNDRERLENESGASNHLQVDSTPDFQSWLEAIRKGQSDEVESLWRNYFGHLAGSVRQRITTRGRKHSDEEDVALSALRTFCRRASADEFEELSDEDELWKLLLTIAIRKAHHVNRKAVALRRGGGVLVLNEAPDGGDSVAATFEHADPSAPTPGGQLDAEELFAEAMDAMPDELTRDILLLRLQGADNQQIAEMMKVNQRTVQRRLKQAERVWLELSEQVGGR